jgi:protein gp37
MLESMGEPPKGYGYPLFDWAHGMLRWPSVTANLWLGCSVEDQATADERIPLLLRCPAAMRFISAEPLLGPIELSLLHTRCPTHDFDGGFCIGPCPDRFGLDWVIVGGESGPGARPMHPDWARAIRDRCVIAGVPFFFKQWGSWVPKSQGWDPRWTNAEPVHRVPKPKEWGCLSYDGTYWKEATTWNGRQEESQDRECIVYRIGKKAAGRLLDGREWNEYPKCYRVVTSRYALRKVK